MKKNISIKMPKYFETFENWEKEILKRPEIKKIEDEMKVEYLLAKSLIDTRIKRQMSQKELADKIKTKQPVISRIESMQSIPTVSMLKKIAKALNAKLEIQLYT